MKVQAAELLNMGLPEFNVGASPKKEEHSYTLSITQKKAILLHYSLRIAEIIKSDGSLSESAKTSRVKFLIAEIGHRVASWMDFPNVSGTIEQVFGSVAGTLWKEFDRLSVLETQEQEDLPPPLISDESAEFMDGLEETINSLKWNLNYQAMQSRVLVADLRKEIAEKDALIAKLQETPKKPVVETTSQNRDSKTQFQVRVACRRVAMFMPPNERSPAIHNDCLAVLMRVCLDEHIVSIPVRGETESTADYLKTLYNFLMDTVGLKV